MYGHPHLFWLVGQQVESKKTHTFATINKETHRLFAHTDTFSANHTQIDGKKPFQDVRTPLPFSVSSQQVESKKNSHLLPISAKKLIGSLYIRTPFRFIGRAKTQKPFRDVRTPLPFSGQQSASREQKNSHPLPISARKLIGSLPIRTPFSAHRQQIDCKGFP